MWRTVTDREFDCQSRNLRKFIFGSLTRKKRKWLHHLSKLVNQQTLSRVERRMGSVWRRKQGA